MSGEAAAGVTVRRIQAEEWGRLREVRLRTLADAPMAFGSTLADEQSRPDAFWQERAAGGAAGETRITFIAERGDQWLGTATGIPSDEEPGGVSLVGMWVDPLVRRTGAATRLAEAVMAWGRDRGAHQIDLMVTETNEPAVRLYTGLGFCPTGETEPLPHTPSLSEVRMVRGLDDGPAGGANWTGE